MTIAVDLGRKATKPTNQPTNYQGRIIDGPLVCRSSPQDRINARVIYRLALAQMGCTRWCFIYQF